jgi:hypothetical protein
MTDYLTYTTLQTLLDTNWNTGVIAKPAFKNKNKTGDYTKNTILIKLSPSSANYITTGNGANDNIVTEFELTLIAESQSDADDYLDEVRRIMNDTISNGWRHIDTWELDDTGVFYIWNVTGKEVLRDF